MKDSRLAFFFAGDIVFTHKNVRPTEATKMFLRYLAPREQKVWGSKHTYHNSESSRAKTQRRARIISGI